MVRKRVLVSKIVLQSALQTYRNGEDIYKVTEMISNKVRNSALTVCVMIVINYMINILNQYMIAYISKKKI